MSSNALTEQLSNAQSLLWIGQGLYPQAPLYNMAMRFDIDAPLDPDCFAQAHVRLVSEFDALRIVTGPGTGDPDSRQDLPSLVFLDERSSAVDYQFINLSDEDQKTVDLATAQSNLRRQIDRYVSRPFDLNKSTSRSILFKVSQTKWCWLLCQHHLISDVASFALLHKRMGQLYADAPSVVQSGFAKFARLQKQVDAERSAGQRAQWWQQQSMAVAPRPSFLQTTQNSPRSRRLDLGIVEAERTALGQMIEKERFALTRSQSWFAVSAAALAVLLWRFDRDYDVVRIGFPVHARADADAKKTVGLLMESVFIDIAPTADRKFADLVREVCTAVTRALSQTGGGVSHRNTLQSAHVYLNCLNVQFGEFADFPCTTQWLHSGFSDPQHPLRLQVYDFDGAGIRMEFDCNVEAIPERKSQAILGGFRQLLRSISHEPHQTIGLLSTVGGLASDACAFPMGSKDQPEVPVQDLMQRLHEVIRNNPDSTALECSGVCYSYKQLGTGISSVAQQLRDCNVSDGQPIMLLASRSAQQIVGLLAILEANASWVPVEPTMPVARIRSILADIAAFTGQQALVLTHESSELDPLVGFDAHKVLRFETDAATTGRQPSTAPMVEPEQRAYIMYTSGSTGEPKGIEISRGSLSRYLHFAENRYLRGDTLDFAHVAPPAFDLGITTSLLPLLTGNRLIVYADSTDPAQAIVDTDFLTAVRDSRIGFMKLTPSQLAVLEDDDLRRSNIRRLIVGGEDFPVSLARRLQDLIGDVEIYNEYGPTETTVGCTAHRFDSGTDVHASVPIGRPMPYAQVTVVDRCLQPLPVGLAGEILITGDGVANGYINRPLPTEQRFVQRRSGLSYRSGDLGRQDDNGCLHYLGRIDRQLKLRGVRIEPAEIENAMTGFDDITDVVVMAVRPQLRQSMDRAYDSQSLAIASGRNAVDRCVRCGIEDSHPNAELGSDQLCNLCQSFDQMRERVSDYFGNESDFRELAEQMRGSTRTNSSSLQSETSRPDCIALLSGGKDSSYMLYRLIDFGLKPLAMTLDNGFISEQAKNNIERVVTDLGVEHIYVQTPHMNAIFVDSLQRFSNVCQGCFKTIYTLATEQALARGIRHVITGLSRGQLFETRLHEIYRREELAADDYDQRIEKARRVYHRIDDAVYRSIGCNIFSSDEVFEQVSFVDFYRYIDVSLQEVMAFLDTNAPWVRPSDTGRSTNCLINDAGIYVHQKERGFHNYALPYSWDVRLGHKTRDAALGELDDELDPSVIEPLLRDIGYYADQGRVADDRRLTAFYRSASSVNVVSLRKHLQSLLPAGLVPVSYVAVDTMPQTVNGKLDTDALARSLCDETPAPWADAGDLSDSERSLVKLYCDVLGHDKVDLRQPFFALGGDSLSAIRIAERARAEGIKLTAVAILDAESIRELAANLPLHRGQAVATNAVKETETEPSPVIDDLVGVEDLDAIAARFNADP